MPFSNTRGAAKIFLRGVLQLWKQKAFEQLLVIRIAKESTYFMDKQFTALTTKTGVPSN